MTFNVDAPALANPISTDIPDIEENFAVLGPYSTIWVPAEAMTPLSTNGAEAGVNEYATNDIMMNYLAFDGGATAEWASFSLPMPENWNLLTILAKFYWAPGSADASESDTVEWKLGGQAIANDGALDVALADAGEVISDAVTAGKNADLHITGVTPAITIGGTPALAKLVHFKLSRNVAGTDDMTEDAWLFGAWLQYKISEEVAEW